MIDRVCACTEKRERDKRATSEEGRNGQLEDYVRTGDVDSLKPYSSGLHGKPFDSLLIRACVTYSSGLHVVIAFSNDCPKHTRTACFLG